MLVSYYGLMQINISRRRDGQGREIILQPTDLLNSTMSGFQTFCGRIRMTLIPPNSVGSQLSW